MRIAYHRHSFRTLIRYVGTYDIYLRTKHDNIHQYVAGYGSVAF